MKKIFFLILCFTVISFTQSSKSILELEEEIKAVPLNPSLGQNNLIQEIAEKKKPALGILYSLILPGMGELYAGSYSSGKYFTIAEGALWGAFIGMNTYGSWQQERYKSFAVSKAGVSPDNKDEEFYGTISEYQNIEQYNTEKALEREFNKMYDPATFHWDWGNSENRRKYRSMWVSSEQTFNDVRFVVGAMLLNRLASAVNAVRLIAAYNKSINEEVSWNFSAGISKPVNLPYQLTLNFQKSF